MPEITPPVDSGAGTGTPPATPPEPPKPITMTQEEFDRIIAERVARAKPKDYDELVKLRDEKAAAAEAEKTELQKEKDARKAAEQAAKERSSLADAKLKRAAILTEATAQGSSDPEIVVALLMGSDDIAVADDGEVTGAKAAIKKLLAEKPVLAKAGTPASGGEFGGNDPKTRLAKIAELDAKGSDPRVPATERQAALREARALKMASVT